MTGTDLATVIVCAVLFVAWLIVGFVWARHHTNPKRHQ